jgi:hypothetical protein
LSGADSSLRTESGGLPYHLAGLQTIRDMIKDMGCEGSLPKSDRDTVDMMTILQELTFSASERNGLLQLSLPLPLPLFILATALAQNEKNRRSHENNSILFEQGRVVKEHHSREDREDDSKHLSSPLRLGTSSSHKSDEKSHKDSEPQLLHSGPLLGQLPRIQPTSAVAGSPTPKQNATPSKKKKQSSGAPNDLPKEFLCELCQRQLTDPVRSVYGNIYEKSVIEDWLKNQGKICPLTGAPLSESDLTPQDDLKIKIRKWILQKSISADDTPIAQADTTSPVSQSKSKSSPTKAANSMRGSTSNGVEDDLYDF